ncbi:MAG: carbohydrate kinase family protein [Oscillospiraceae bacterium]|nr:carbohydrate kinase family protein [Oscillospiraceae bacterium]
MAEYIVSGNVIIDEIHQYTGESYVRLGGGAIYALSGYRVWTDSCAFVGYAGCDFFDNYGEWLRNSGINECCVTPAYDYDFRSILTYDENGFYTSSNGESFRTGLNKEHLGRCTPTMECCTPYAEAHKGKIKGWEIHSHVDTVFYQQFKKLARECGFKTGCELVNFGRKSYMEPTETIKEVIRNLDFFSMNLTECKDLIDGVKDLYDAEEFFKEFTNCSIFLRNGTDGAEMISGGRVYRAGLADDFGQKDSTGCGNSSTAAAFWAVCEGLDPLTAACIGSATAALNVAHEGLITDFSSETVAKCAEIAKRLRHESLSAEEM